jgi:hypothetical protein
MTAQTTLIISPSKHIEMKIFEIDITGNSKHLTTLYGVLKIILVIALTFLLVRNIRDWNEYRGLVRAQLLTEYKTIAQGTSFSDFEKIHKLETQKEVAA